VIGAFPWSCSIGQCVYSLELLRILYQPKMSVGLLSQPRGSWCFTTEILAKLRFGNPSYKFGTAGFCKRVPFELGIECPSQILYQT